MSNELLTQSVEKTIRLDSKEWQTVLQLFDTKCLEKNEYLLREGEVCDFVAFVNSGALQYFMIVDSGEEKMTDFAFGGDWVCDNHSRLKQLPSGLYIRATERTELTIIPHSQLQKGYELVPQLERLGRTLMEEAFVKVVQQTIDLQTLSATERYLKLIDQYPLVLQQIPLCCVANYLGIAPKSLSRIRKQLAKR